MARILRPQYYDTAFIYTKEEWCPYQDLVDARCADVFILQDILSGWQGTREGLRSACRLSEAYIK